MTAATGDRCECGAAADDINFDRSLCGMCDGMHYFCNGCGRQVDECQPRQEPPAARDGDAVDVQVNEHGWWVLRAVEGDFGGKIVVDATGEMVGPDLIDVAIQARKGASAAVALSKQQALALAEELRRAAS